ncbi:MAG: ABC transporter substrate-binding protein [Sphaerochaetaceae bacterium]
MKKHVLIIMLLLCVLSFLAAEQTVTDMFAREVTLPDSDKITIVFSGNPTASVFLYSLAPDLLGNWNFKMAKDALAMFPKEYQKLPVHGTLWGNSKPANKEEILKMNPDFILLKGPNTDSVKEVCDSVEELLQIPVLYIDYDIHKIPEAYELLGKVLGREERAAVLAEYAEELITETMEFTASLEEDEKRRVFYSLSKQGLDTYPAGTANGYLIELCGGNNVVKSPYTRESGPMRISFEELIIGQPEIIIAGHETRTKLNDGSLYATGKWAALNTELAIVPHAPFNAFDKPPSVNQLGGIIWLRNVLYPTQFPADKKEIDDFNALFFHIE